MSNVKKKTFTLEKVMTTSTTVWFSIGGLIIVVAYFGFKVFLGDHLRWFSNPMFGLSAALALGMSGLGYLRKFFQKDKVIIEIEDDKNIKIYFDDELKVSAPISELKKIFTIHYINKKADIQAEIIFTNIVINLYDTGNYEGKTEFDKFIIYLEKQFKFTYKKAPMSLRWSKHYVEYTNPLYNE